MYLVATDPNAQTFVDKQIQGLVAATSSTDEPKATASAAPKEPAAKLKEPAAKPKEPAAIPKQEPPAAKAASAPVANAEPARAPIPETRLEAPQKTEPPPEAKAFKEEKPAEVVPAKPEPKLEPKVDPPKPEPKVDPPKPEPKAESPKPEAKPEPAPEPKVEKPAPPKEEPKPEAPRKPDPEVAAEQAEGIYKNFAALMEALPNHAAELKGLLEQDRKAKGLFEHAIQASVVVPDGEAKLKSLDAWARTLEFKLASAWVIEAVTTVQELRPKMEPLPSDKDELRVLLEQTRNTKDHCAQAIRIYGEDPKYGKRVLDLGVLSRTLENWAGNIETKLK